MTGKIENKERYPLKSFIFLTHLARLVKKLGHLAIQLPSGHCLNSRQDFTKSVLPIPN